MPTNAAITAVLDLPTLDNPLIQKPDHIVNPFPGQDRRPGHRFTLLQGEGRWLWAHVLRAVGGWEVIAAGVLSRTIFKTADDAGEYLVRQFLVGSGDGYDHLSHEAFLQKGRIAHIRLEGEVYAYCGETGLPAVFALSEPNHVEQHCIPCDRAYRAAHYGRTPVTH